MGEVHSLVPTVAILGPLTDERYGLRVLLPILGRIQMQRPLTVVWGVTEPPPKQVELIVDVEPVLVGSEGEIRSLIARADVVALSQAPPGWIRGAMASATCVVVMDSPEADGLCVHGMNALVVPQSNPEALEGALCNLIENPWLRRRLIRGGRLGRAN